MIRTKGNPNKITY